MSSSRKLLLGAAVLGAAILAALPFQENLLKQQGDQAERRSRVRWRETQASMPAPLDDQARAPDDDSSGAEPRGDDEPANRVSHAVALRSADVSRPPRIPAVYQPLLNPAALTPPTSPPLEEERPLANSPPPASPGPSTAAPGSNESWTKPTMKIVRHRIRDGDTLQALAARYLGDPNRYREIYESNKHRLPSEEVLPLNLQIEIYVPR